MLMSDVLYDLNATGDQVNKIITEIRDNLTTENDKQLFYVYDDSGIIKIGTKIAPAAEVSYSDTYDMHCDNVQDAIDSLYNSIDVDENEIPVGDGNKGLTHSNVKYYEYIKSHYTDSHGFPNHFPNEEEFVFEDMFVFYNGIGTNYSINETYKINEEEYNVRISLSQQDEEKIVASIDDSINVKSLEISISELAEEPKEFNIADSEYKIVASKIKITSNGIDYWHTYINVFLKNFTIDSTNPPVIEYILNDYNFSIKSSSKLGGYIAYASISNNEKFVYLYYNISSRLNSDKTERIAYLKDGTKMSSEFISVFSEEIIDIDDNVIHFPNNLPLRIVGGSNTMILATNSKAVNDTELDGNIRPEEEVALLKMNNKAKANFLDNSVFKTNNQAETNFLDNSLVNISNNAQIIVKDSAKAHIDNNSELFIHAGKIHIDNGDQSTQITSFYQKEYDINVDDYASIYPDDGWATLEHILEIESSDNSNYLTINITESDDLIGSSLINDTLETYGYTKTTKITKKIPSDGLAYYNAIIKYTKLYNPENPYSHFATPSILMHGSPCLCLEKTGTIITRDNAALVLEGKGKIMARDNATMYLNQNSLFIMDSAKDASGSPDMELGSSLVIDNGCQIVFNGYKDSTPKGNCYPYLICGPNEFIYDAQASDGDNTTVAPGPPHFAFGSPSLLESTVNRPRFRIGGNTMIMIDSGTNSTGSNYIKIGTNDGEKLEFHLTGNIFQQMTGNAHTEMHDDSKIIMRGTLKTENDTQIPPWLDGVNFIPDSVRPILQGDKGPILGLYDNSTIMIRGRWDNINGTVDKNKSFNKYGFSDADLSMLENIKREVDAASGDLEIMNNPSTNIPDDYPELYNSIVQTITNSICQEYNLSEDAVLITSIKLEGVEIKEDMAASYISISSSVTLSKPENWSEHLEKKENNPYIEIIENSELKLSDNAKINITDNFSISTTEEGFVFSDGTDTVSFTISELQRLKTLLN